MGISDVPSALASQIQDAPKIYQRSVRKVILSANPNSSDGYSVVAIYGWGHNLAVLRSGYRTWTYLNKPIRSFSDALWHKNQLYAVTFGGEVMHIDGLSPRTVYPSNPDSKSSDRVYLIESTCGELLMIKEDQHGWFCTTIDFKVHKLEPSTDGLYKKLEIKEVGGDALFLGDNYSMAVAGSDQMCLKNCIYYINDTTNVLAGLYGYRVSSDMGIFCLENGEFGTHYIANPSLEILPPVWITPILSDGWV